MSKFSFKLSTDGLSAATSKISALPPSSIGNISQKAGEQIFNDNPKLKGLIDDAHQRYLANNRVLDDENPIVQSQQVQTDWYGNSAYFNLPYQNPPHKPFGMKNMREALSYFKTLYGLGTTLTSGYVVTIKPYGENKTKQLPIFNQEIHPVLGLLAVDVEMPVLGAAFEQKRFGVFNFSRLAEYNYPSFTITFLETKNRHILRSLMAYKDMMTSKDGTVLLPADYALSLSVRVYGNGQMMKDGTVIDKLVVAINMDSLQGLNAKEPLALEIPVMFNVLSH